MHHEDIKAAIRKRGVTPSGIARHLDVSDTIVSAVIRGVTKSERVAKAIAQITDLTLDALWPGLYDPAPAPGVAELLRAHTRKSNAAKRPQPATRSKARA